MPDLNGEVRIGEKVVELERIADSNYEDLAQWHIRRLCRKGDARSHSGLGRQDIRMREYSGSQTREAWISDVLFIELLY